jgi:positive regulator of sigma E activity
MLLTVPGAGDLSVGDAVKVTFPYSSTWAQTSVVFVVPLLLMLAGAVAGFLVAGAAGISGGGADLTAAAGGVAGIAAGMIIARGYDRRLRRRLTREIRLEVIAARKDDPCAP